MVSVRYPLLALFGTALVCLGSAARAAEAKGYAVIPLKNVGNAFLVDVQVNDIPMQLIIDTGAPMTVLVGDKATKAGLAWGRARNACEIRSLRCGAAELHGVGAYVASFHGENAGAAKRKVTASARDGLLGWDTLRQWGAVLDTAAMRLYLRTDPKVTNDLGARLRASGWTEISLRQRKLHALAPSTINGKSVTWVLDTGAGVTTLDRDVALAAGLKPVGKGIPTHTLYKLRNTSDATEIPDLVVGDYHAGPFAVSLVNLKHAFGGSTIRGDGLLGFEFLRLNSAVIDSLGSKLYLRRPR